MNLKTVKKKTAPDPAGVARPLCTKRLQELLYMISCHESRQSFSLPPVILCIGTDRIVGDSLGPLVGTLLKKAAGNRLPVYGTLKRTVHAENLHETIDEIKKKHPGRIVVAIDASLGSREQVGAVLVRPGSLKPGAGVHKRLPDSGDIAITGITNADCSHPYLSLQTARLSTIVDMAEQISQCIEHACLGPALLQSNPALEGTQQSHLVNIL